MSRIQIFDRAMCCPTGVCGPQVDNVLPRFAADLDWLAKQGHQVERYNLAQDAGQFAGNATIQQKLASEGVECLPVVIIDDVIVGQGDYPDRDQLLSWLGEAPSGEVATTSKPTGLPVTGDDCCGGSGCC
ncbi:Arsenical resistance operon trans-acting repressor ArsD [Crateriforma conspicua]|uniref:Arsenical resistance operon trans-acting repressor ArsD n=1 Tax=Crateriforma conspicua TaxID=2527996 RepID=A0A5C6FHN8_9PLAN|nr:arsenite efflux transporter metallochaperone ArsD [Crateriforma conspicua]TWU61765.1 Arsenical resistance operon trans-acting repressor ArsD [Crateriforma conspicua]